MTIFDTILIIILAGFVFYGLFFGLIRTIGSLLGVLVGAFLAGHFYLGVFGWIQNLFFGHDNLGKVVAFIVIFTIVNRLVAFAFVLLDRAFGIISIIPFLKTINRLAGAIFGFILGGLVLGLILYVAAKYAVIGYWFGDRLASSQVAPFLIKFAGGLTPLLPAVLNKLKGVI